MKEIKTIFALMLLVFVMGNAAYAVTLGQVNVNTASFNELTMVPYVNGEIAMNIIDFRHANGPFKTVDDLLKVEGIDKKVLKGMKPYLKFEGESNIQILQI
jgi:competence protein ComEA